MMQKNRVLIVDDEADIRELLSLTLERMGLATDCAANEFEATQYLLKHGYDLCLTDMRLPDGDGLKLIEHVGKHCPAMPVAVITAHGSAENAVAALKAGAFDYLAKPVSLSQLRALVKSALKLPPRKGRAEGEGDGLSPGGLPVLLGDSPLMHTTREMIAKLARSQAPVHVAGESGSGKELAARLIHVDGPRRESAFVPVNCGAIPENLMESEFFGYKKGAFTGADADRDGFFQAANGGTLFLDEVADLPLHMQVKLLRTIQEKKVRKIGSPTEDNVDVRIISATHRNLAAAVKEGRFRQDLYYRLNVIELRMPALRELREDIPVLARAILEKTARQSGLAGVPQLTVKAMEALEDYVFPGNVRELENILERAVALATGDRIAPADLQLTRDEAEAAGAEEDGGEGAAAGRGGLPLQEHLDRVEKDAILQALEKTRYNRTAAAKLLGITFRALRYRMERLGIN
jgi:two-component system response regulator PilR (NtrC family)